MKATKILSKYGTVKTCKAIRNIVTIVLTDGFSENAGNTFEFMKVCTELFPNHPIIETCITEKDFAMIVLSQDDKQEHDLKGHSINFMVIDEALEYEKSKAFKSKMINHIESSDVPPVDLKEWMNDFEPDINS